MSSTSRGGKRTPADFYPTPSWCVTRVLDAIPLPGGEWLEPCAGDGAIIRAARQTRRDVAWQAVELRKECEHDLEREVGPDRFVCCDFLEWRAGRKFDVLLTNPPYSLAESFLLAGFAAANHVVLLLRLNFLASAKRADLMRSRAPDVYVLPNRPSFSGHGTDSVEYAWFHWPPENRPRGSLVVLPTSSADERRAGVSAQESLFEVSNSNKGDAAQQGAAPDGAPVPRKLGTAPRG